MSSGSLHRLINATSVAVIYGFISNSTSSTTSRYSIWNWLNSEENNLKIQQLKDYKLNLLYEANEIIRNINAVYFQELEFIADVRKRATQDTSTVPDLLSQLDPEISKQQSTDPRVNNSLRLLNENILKHLFHNPLTEENIKPHTPSHLFKLLTERRDRLATDIQMLFLLQQRMVCDTISSYQSKIISNYKYGEIVSLSTFACQLLGCSGFLYLSKKLWGIKASIPLPVNPMPFSKAATYLSIIPLMWLALQAPDLVIVNQRERLDTTPPPYAITPPDSSQILPSILQMQIVPLSPFSFSRLPPIYHPCSNQNEILRPWSVFVNHVAPPIVEGLVFRKLLLNALLFSSSPLKAHTFVAIAASACYSGMNSRLTPLYEINAGTGPAYDDNHPPHEYYRSFVFSTFPLFLQMVQYVSGSLPLSILLGIVSSITRQINEICSDDILFSTLYPQYYRCVIQLYSSIRYYATKPFMNTSKTSPKFIQMINDTTRRYLKTVYSIDSVSETDPVLTVDDVVHLHRLIFAKYLLQPSQDTSIFELNLVPGIYVDGGSQQFQFDLTQHSIREYYTSKDAKLDIRALTSFFHFLFPPDIVFRPPPKENIKKDFFYWMEEATEEELLILLDEIHAVKLEKIYHCVRKYRSSAGAWLCLEYQGDELTRDEGEGVGGLNAVRRDLMKYNEELMIYIRDFMQIEGKFDLISHGLTPYSLQLILEKRGQQFPSVLDLSSSWEKYYTTPEYYSKVAEEANPFRFFRPEVWKRLNEKQSG